MGGADPAGEGRTFEGAMRDLERIVAELESGELPLEQSLALYERGVGLIRWCGAQLDRAEARLQQLTLDAEGRAVLSAVEEPGS